MALINVADVKVHDNPAKPGDPFKFEITFEARTELNDGTSLCFVVGFHS